ncbi:MAG: biotin/lipoyl-containing protein [Chitinophagales bacterium]
MGREIQLSLVYRDMWQSSGKYMPRVDQLVRVAEPIIEMGCFARIETNGGGFEQINLLFGENPNKAVRAWTAPFNKAGIQTHMLERGLNGIRMSPVSADVRKLMFKVKKKQGTDISRSFDGLNDARNIIDSIRYAKEGGMIAQAALSITHSKVHTVEYYINLGKELIEGGADEICIKDMAGIGRPVSIGKIVKGIKDAFPKILIQYHGHSTPGFSVASSLEAARAGADIIDVGMEPLSWGTGHADLLTIHEMLKDAGFSLPPINQEAYMETRRLTQEFIDDFLGYYIDPQNRYMSSLLIGPGLPGGMMGSLMADLPPRAKSINKSREKFNKESLTENQVLMELFKEVEYVWPKMGYPPLVTPYSQYVKNTALANIMQMQKGKERWSIMGEDVWDMLTGRSGKLPSEIAPELVAMAKAQGREFYTGHPQELYKSKLEFYRQDMLQKGWDLGQDDEELLEYAMHPTEYVKYKSGEAKAKFEEDLAEKRAAAKVQEDAAKGIFSAKPNDTNTQTSMPNFQPKTLNVRVGEEEFTVTVSYDGSEMPVSQSLNPPAIEKSASNGQSTNTNNGKLEDILAPLEGVFYLRKNPSDPAVNVGDMVKVGDTIGYIEAMKVSNAVKTTKSGRIAEILVKTGEEVEDDDVLMKISPM